MPTWLYTKGLHELGNGAYAYLQPDGSWGWSNAGLIIDEDQSLLVDTLFDLQLTQDMLDSMRAATPTAKVIDTVVNTHANGDHCYGNQLLDGAEIIASKTSAEEMNEIPPGMLAQIMNNSRALGGVGEYLTQIFGHFHFAGIIQKPPTRTFERRLDLQVGCKTVTLIEVGPAHTKGDVLVYIPANRTIFTGDVLFIDSTPIMWAGPVSNWLNACDMIQDMDVETIVPGHGPITDKQGVRRVKEYLSYIYTEARKRYDAGMSSTEAVFDIALNEYSVWSDAERIAVNVHTLYREFSGEISPPNIMELFGLMAKLRKR